MKALSRSSRTFARWSSLLQRDPWMDHCLKEMEFDPLTVTYTSTALLKAAVGAPAVPRTNKTMATSAEGFEKHTSAEGLVMNFPLTVTNGASNVFKTIHGGMLMSLVEVTTTLHLLHYLEQQNQRAAGEENSSGGSSTTSSSSESEVSPLPFIQTVGISTQFLKAAPYGTEMFALSRLDKVSDTTAVISVRFLDAADPCTVFATGTHTCRLEAL